MLHSIGESYTEGILVNVGTEGGRWIARLERAAQSDPASRRAFLRLTELVRSLAEYGLHAERLEEFVGRVASVLPPELQPPNPFPSDPGVFGIFTPSRVESIRNRNLQHERLEAARRDKKMSSACDRRSTRSWRRSLQRTGTCDTSL